MTVIIEPMQLKDYDQVLDLWRTAEGVGLSQTDSPERIAAFLMRNPGLSFVAREGDVIVGAVLCGHDGRRGYLHHLAVKPIHRRQGLGRRLVNHCILTLNEANIDKCHLFVFHQNKSGLAFWQQTDWSQRVELVIFSRNTDLGDAKKIIDQRHGQAGNVTVETR